jgi:hypothetical protein
MNIAKVSDSFDRRRALTPSGGQMTNRLLAAAANVVHSRRIIDQ